MLVEAPPVDTSSERCKAESVDRICSIKTWTLRRRKGKAIVPFSDFKRTFEAPAFFKSNLTKLIDFDSRSTGQRKYRSFQSAKVSDNAPDRTVEFQMNRSRVNCAKRFAQSIVICGSNRPRFKTILNQQITDRGSIDRPRYLFRTVSLICQLKQPEVYNRSRTHDQTVLETLSKQFEYEQQRTIDRIDEFGASRVSITTYGGSNFTGKKAR